MSTEKFESWAIVELFGKTRMAGLVTECSIGGAGFVRVDVPECDGQAAFTRYLGPSSIFAINPCTEELARAAAGRYRPEPIHAYEIRSLLPSPAPTEFWDEEDT